MHGYELFSVAVNTQPEMLARAVTAIDASLKGASVAPWMPGETVAVLGMGASTNSAHALIAALRDFGIRGNNITASDLTTIPEGFEPGDHYVVVSESGRSPEPVMAARALAPGRRIGITNFPNAVISEAVDLTIGFGEIPDSPVYTAGYVATIASYAALLRAAGLPESFDIATTPDLVSRSLTAYKPLAGVLADHLAGARTVDFVGRGYSFSSAMQGSLVFREALRIPTAGYDTYQYLHGPMESAGAGTGLVIFGDDRELDIVESQAEAGVAVVVVSSAAEERLDRLAHENVIVVPLEAATGFARVIAETVVIQVITEAAAAVRGITVEEFLYHQTDTKLEP